MIIATLNFCNKEEQKFYAKDVPCSNDIEVYCYLSNCDMNSDYFSHTFHYVNIIYWL